MDDIILGRSISWIYEQQLLSAVIKPRTKGMCTLSTANIPTRISYAMEKSGWNIQRVMNTEIVASRTCDETNVEKHTTELLSLIKTFGEVADYTF
jgi:hypothetical protein